jgi:hypothetical protein
VVDVEEEEEEEEEEESKVPVGNGGDNYSIFRMMQEGVLDLDKEKKREAARKRKEEKAR